MDQTREDAILSREIEPYFVRMFIAKDNGESEEDYEARIQDVVTEMTAELEQEKAAI